MESQRQTGRFYRTIGDLISVSWHFTKAELAARGCVFDDGTVDVSSELLVKPSVLEAFADAVWGSVGHGHHMFFHGVPPESETGKRLQSGTYAEVLRARGLGQANDGSRIPEVEVNGSIKFARVIGAGLENAVSVITHMLALEYRWPDLYNAEDGSQALARVELNHVPQVREEIGLVGFSGERGQRYSVLGNLEDAPLLTPEGLDHERLETYGEGSLRCPAGWPPTAQCRAYLRECGVTDIADNMIVDLVRHMRRAFQEYVAKERTPETVFVGAE